MSKLLMNGGSFVLVNKKTGLSFNFAYGETPPEDTTKLWVKCPPPAYIKTENIFSGAQGYVDINQLDWVLCNTSSCDIRTIVKKDNFFYSGVYRAISRYDLINKTSGEVFSTQNTMASCEIIGDKLYAICDVTSYGWITEYDINTGEATSKQGAGPSVRGAATATVGTNIYIFGGYNTRYSGEYSKAIYKYDTLNKSGTSMGNLLPVGSEHLNACSIGTDCYIGISGLDAIYKYDTLKNEVTVVKSLPAALPASTVPLMVAQGNTVFLTKNSTTLYMYNIITDTLTEVTTPSLSDFGACNDSNGIYLASKGGAKSYLMNTHSSLPENNLTLILGYNTNPLPIMKANEEVLADMNLGINYAFIGDENNEAKPVEIYQYKDETWVKVV